MTLFAPLTRLFPLAFLAIAVLAIAACRKAPTEASKKVQPVAVVHPFIASEEAVQELTPKLGLIAKWLLKNGTEPVPKEMGEVLFPPIWNELDSEMKWVDGSFGVLSAELSDKPRGDKTITLKTKFEGRRRGVDDKIVGVKSKQRLTWQHVKDSQWQLVKWEPLDFVTKKSSKPYFEEVLERALPDATARGQRHAVPFKQSLLRRCSFEKNG